jgi:hypothetical protein
MNKTKEEIQKAIELKMMKRDQLNKEIFGLEWKNNTLLQEDEDRYIPKDGDYVIIEPHSGKFPCFVRNGEYVIPMDKTIITRKATKQEYRLFWDFDSMDCYEE